MELSAAAASTVSYAYPLQSRHLFGCRGLSPVSPIMAARARDAAPLVLAVAELDAVPVAALAAVEGAYADTPTVGPWYAPWQQGLIGLLRSGGLFLGVSSGIFSSARFVQQVRASIALRLPDAPPELHQFDDVVRIALERAFEHWSPRYADADPANRESWAAFEQSARRWSSTCDVPFPFPSDLTSQAEDESATAKRRLRPFVRRQHVGPASLVGPLEPADPQAVREVLASDALGQSLTPAPTNLEGTGGEPTRAHWRAARTAAELLLVGSNWKGRLVRVGDSLRVHARALSEATLAVGWFTHASPLHLERVSQLCDRVLEIRYGGLQRWEAGLVWCVDSATEEICALRARGSFDAIDRLLRTRVIEMNGALPPDMPLASPFDPDSNDRQYVARLRKVLSAEITAGRGKRGAVGSHGYAFRWLDAYGIEFPPYPTSRRPKRSARRLT